MAGEWIKCTLADACSSIDYGLTASASEERAGPKFLRITDIVTGHINWNTVPHVAIDDSTAAKYRLCEGDIVLARTGASTGTSAYVKCPPLAVFASYLVRLQAKPEFDARYLAYYLRSADFWTFIRGVLGDKSAQPNASASTMTKAPLRAPKDKAEQRAIAHILGTLDDKIELNRQMSQTLEEMARAIYKSWFVDFDPVRAKCRGEPMCSPPIGQAHRPAPTDWHLPQHILDLFPDRLVDSELGEIPEGWGVRTLGELLELAYGKALKADVRQHGTIPVYGSNGQVGWHDEKLVIGPGVIVGRKGNPGVVKWVPTDFFPIDTTFYVVPKDRCPSLKFLFYALQLQDLASLSADSAVPGLNRNIAYMSSQILPSRAILAAFDAAIQPLFQRINEADREARTLAALRDSLLPKLLSGEIRVKDAERFLKERGL